MSVTGFTFNEGEPSAEALGAVPRPGVSRDGSGEDDLLAGQVRMVFWASWPPAVVSGDRAGIGLPSSTGPHLQRHLPLFHDHQSA
jgi:hypothetical protein